MALFARSGTSIRVGRFAVAVAVVAAVAAAACASDSGLDERTVAAAETVVSIGSPEGFTAGTSPTNGSVVRDVAGVPVDFTGAMTMKRQGRILFLAPGVPDDGFVAYCQAQVAYLDSLSASLTSPLKPPLTVDECVGYMGAAVNSPASDVEVLWTSTGTLGAVSVSASLVAIPSPEGPRDALAVDLVPVS